ncbi:MAG: TRAP transporter small permease [Hyphomicrobiaceae bacterium]
MRLRWLKRGDRRITDALCVALAATLTGLVFAEITAKAIFSVSILWSTDFVTYLLLWMIFLGGALCARDHEQVSLQIVVDRLPSGLRFVLQGAQRLCTIAVMLALAYSLFRLLDVLHTSWVPTMPVRQSYFALPCLAALVLYAGYEVADLIRLVRTGRSQ